MADSAARLTGTFAVPETSVFGRSQTSFALVRQCLGHKAIGSTMKYVAVSDSQASEAAQVALMRLY